MPPAIAPILAAIQKVSWKRVLAAVTWLYTVGKSRLEQNLTKKEREELTKLLSKSKGKPGNLTARERTRLRRLVYKAALGHFPS